MNNLFSEIKGAKGRAGGVMKKVAQAAPPKFALAQMIAARNNNQSRPPPPQAPKKETAAADTSELPDSVLFQHDESKGAFIFSFKNVVPRIVEKSDVESAVVVPLTPCVYRMTDYTMGKKEPITTRACVLKLGVLRCLQRECKTLNTLLRNRFTSSSSEDDEVPPPGALEEDELGKTRFMELLSNCGVYQKVSELVLHVAGQTHHDLMEQRKTGNNNKVIRIPQVDVEQLDEFLETLDTLVPELARSRKEIEETQSVSFYPGLGEFFTPGSKILCFPDGMEGSPLGCTVVQSWYVEEEVSSSTSFKQQQQPKKIKRRFVMCVEYIISVGDALVFVAATDVYPEFPNVNRNMPIRELTHRKLSENDDKLLLQRLQQRGEFYASISTNNHFLEYYPNSFYPIITGSWNNNAIRPLSKGGRVMVDVKRGILENHLPVRTSDGMSDTVKEAIKLWEQSKRTGVAVPFRTCRLSKSLARKNSTFDVDGDADRPHLWQSWPMVTGFSFTSRVWGKLLLGMPKINASGTSSSEHGRCGNCGYINFQDQAFEQLVLDEGKKELIRAVARNAGDNDDDDDDDDVGFALDVVANKGAASIFLLHGPPGCGKTLTAEAIAELLEKPLYIVTAGDLGISADQVEKSLGTVLELCQTWDALVLIDEADVFLEARSSTEIQRNALVCVMLRLLEYYSGCLFLSSNRDATTIDAAIASRITVMLGYPPLDAKGRGKVWKNLVELVPQLLDEPQKKKKNPFKYRLAFTLEDYQTLAEQYELNGRQIKNSIILARALARERRIPLSLPILQRAVTAVAGEQAQTKISSSKE